MKPIIPPRYDIFKVLGPQSPKEASETRLTKFMLRLPVDSGELFLHTLTGEMLFLTDEEAQTLGDDVRPQLTSDWFFVPKDLDEMKLADDLRKSLLCVGPKKSQTAITQYSILTTTACNARCPYCFEVGARPAFMSDETADKLIEYMDAHREGQPLFINWFGGEPLLGVKIIDKIANALNEREIPFTSQVLTNGYLFDDETVKKAKESWHVQTVQITLDGEEETYNRIKNYVTNDPNAFKRVLDNVQRIADADMRIHIRFNLDKENGAELKRLYDALRERFPVEKYKNFRVYAHILFQYCNDGIDIDMDELRDLTEFEQSLGGSGLLPSLRVRGCMASADSCLTVTPDGRFGKCESCMDESKLVGSVHTGEFDNAVIEAWKVPMSCDKCDTCAIYPWCNDLADCNSFTRSCTEASRTYKTTTAEIGMRNTYKNFCEYEKQQKEKAEKEALEGKAEGENGEAAENAEAAPAEETKA